ncbi:MAG: HAD family hydrolase [Anaerolineae bacterium]
MINVKAKRQTTDPGPIRLVVVDVDGCLSGGEAQPIDLDLLRFLAELNDQSREDPWTPAVTYITGRGAEYVEVIQQLTRGYFPVIYEMGAAALLPAAYQFIYSPFIATEAFEHIHEARERLACTLGRAKRAYYQPGLELTLSIYPVAPMTIEECKQEVDAILEPYRQNLKIEQSRTCVDVMPLGAGKDNGLRWLADLVQIPFSVMAGFGDSPNDRAFLDLVAFSGVPANAHPQVKQRVDYVSPYPNGKGVHDFLERCLAYNQARK